ncbi:hypothetical protein [Nocardioides soli]|uniref:Uncharacterized protein n=1 Tax=Nocardioides soli TaxID=1036020 RepID=A0A7W4VS70_9ACTN|nr:hypothetical protein [Nocardioides soli]MBB3040407.1 hypothetical protein [Nocardioides soli]
MSGDGNEPCDGPEGPEVGSLAEEAAKLLGALTGWAKDATHDVEEHLATGAPECSYCPICRTVHAVRELSPEVRTQLASAATSALHALAGLVAAAGTHDRGAAESGVEHIDLDDEGDEWPDDTDPEEDDR